MRAVLIVLAGCYPVTDPPDPQIPDQPTMFFRLDETGDIPRRDQVYDITIFPWQRLGVGVYHQDGIGTTRVPAVVGDGQHIDGAAGYHFATYSHTVMDHQGRGFTWVGWASIDPADGVYTDQQTLLAKWTGEPDTDVPHDQREYRVQFDPAANRWQLELSADGLEGPGHSVVVTHPTMIERDRMYFVEAWHDADAKTVNLRVSDQSARGELASAASAGAFSGGGDLDVGAQNACSANHLQGTLDALGYWTRTLSDAESLALWNGGAGREL